jgi:hypothetical protein
MTILLTIEIEGGNLGPFNLYSNTDGYTNPFATNITKAALEAGYTSTSVPPDTTTVQVKSVGNCSNSINIVLENTTSTTTSTTTTTVPIVPCNGTSDSGGAGLKDIYVNLDPAGGVITFLFDPQGAADKMEFYHGLPQDDGINKVATTSQSASEDFGGNYGPFDDEYGTPPLPIIFPNDPTTDVDQFIGTLKGTVPTRQSEYTSDTGCTIPSMTIGSVTYDQVIWWRYDAADYLANPLVTIRITGSGDNTLWNSIRICNVCTTTTTTTATPTTTTTSSSTSTSTSTSTSSTSTSTSTSSSTTTTTTTACVNRPTGLTNGNLIEAVNNAGDPSRYFANVSVAYACETFSYFRSVTITTGSAASFQDMQYSSLTIGQKIYRDNNETNCILVPTGYYWFQPNITSPITYFKGIDQISIVTVVDGVITAIDVCDYVPPTTTTTTTL